VAKLLLDEGAEVNARGTLFREWTGGKTPLHVAASATMDRHHLVALLLERGAEVEARDHGTQHSIASRG
jgi:ankyrin repeat protein